ncbi:hypothetical protein GOP47_0020459 [Adiantum capillus-veneris]|uniref:L-gulonolactone oxidase n=1 Tax=Adiantum capillus-veneris TaxID=13818 RepID=A0A9D4Z703_ADICA|nr:hypothetical protein GOP47_0020459 [Adiantum capillus-veneris]
MQSSRCKHGRSSSQIALSMHIILWAVAAMRGGVLYASCDNVAQVHVSSLPSPVECSEEGRCKVRNYQGVWTDRDACLASRVVYPSTEAELVSAVAAAVEEGQKMKVVTEIGHSMSKLSCPAGDDGLLISTRDYMPDAVHVNRSDMSASVDAGLQLRHFVRELALHNVTIPHTPLWDGVSVGGVIATGSHGSGFFEGGSVISDYVNALRMVVPATAEEGYAKVLTLRRGDEAFRAAKISLGLLGVVSKVTFAVLPMFKRSLTVKLVSDDDLEERMAPFAKEHDFASLFWVPSASKVLYKEENAVDVSQEGDGVNAFPLVQPMLASHILKMRAHQDAVERSRDASGLCMAGEKMVEHRVKTGDGYVNSPGRFDGFPVVGFNHHMQTVGGCQLHKPSSSDVGADDWWTCKWDPRLEGIFYHHTAVAIPLASVADFVRDVKRLREINPQGMCVLNMFGGIHVRFVASSDAFLGDKVDSAVFELVYYRARDGKQGRLFQDVMEEIEQMMVFKYMGKPHWGKNRNVAFHGVAQKVVSTDKFLSVKAELDPDGLFSSAWTDELLGLHDTFAKADDDHCALDGICTCNEDRHCSPSTGYTCQRGYIFHEARVCRSSN